MQAVISDKKVPVPDAQDPTIVAFYNPGIITATDYYPFGMVMPNRSVDTDEYRYGYQAQLTDQELWDGAVSYKYRIEDPRIGRFFSVDPLAPEYPWNSPYGFSENRVIDGVELEGLEYIKATDPNVESSCDNEDGTGEAVIGGQTYSTNGTIEYNGEQFINLGRHLFRTPDGISNTGQIENMITSWVYNPTKDALNSDNWVKYDSQGEYKGFKECAYAAAKSCGNQGYAPLLGYANNQIYMYDPEKVLAKYLQPTKISISKAIDILHMSLERGMPVMVGVSYPEGNNGGGDNITDHYIVIYNRGFSDGKEFFLFSENVANNANEGMASYRKIYLQSDGTLETEDYDASYNGKIYTVTGVRLNSISKRFFKLR